MAQAPDSVATKTVQGTVRRMTTAPMGEVDGAVLDDGTVLHWPPHLSQRFTSVVTTGDRVRALGWKETGPEGDTRLEARTITNLRTNAASENDALPPGQEVRSLPRPPSQPRRRFDPANDLGATASRTVKGTVQRLTTRRWGRSTEPSSTTVRRSTGRPTWHPASRGLL